MSDGNLLAGQQFEQQSGIVKQFTEKMMDRADANAVAGQARTEITPHDYASALVRVWASNNAAYAAIAPVKTPAYINLSRDMVPDTLTSLAVTFNSTEQTGEDINQGPDIVVTGDSGSASLSASASAQAGASVIPDVQPVIKVTPSRVSVNNFVMYMPMGFTLSDLFTRISATYAATGVLATGTAVCAADHGFVLNQRIKFTAATGVVGFTVGATYYIVTIPNSARFTFSATEGGAGIGTATATTFTVVPLVFEWPLFFPVSHTITLKGQQVSVRQNASSREAGSFTSGPAFTRELLPGAGKRSDGFSIEAGLTSRLITIPPTIHAAITISPATLTKGALTLVKANLPIMTYSGTGSFPGFPGITNEPTPKGGFANAEISPTSLTATTPAAIPSKDLYLMELQTQAADADNMYVSAAIFNAQVFA